MSFMPHNDLERRRRQLLKMMGKGAIAILPTAPERIRTRDVHYPFRPDSDFYYLTGFAEPDAVAVLVSGGPREQFVLFARDRDPVREAWEGPRTGCAGAIRDFGADEAFPIGELEKVMPNLMAGCSNVFYTLGNTDFDHRVVGWVNRLKGKSRTGTFPPQGIMALDRLLHDMRLFKSRDELALMQRSAEIAVAAHRRAMRFARPERTEHQVMAEITHEFQRNAAHNAYHPIVGSGANSCILHYQANNAQLRDGDLLLIDAGCEYQLYASDITRTIPVNGRYSPEQRAVYEIVLEAQRAAIAATRPGNHCNQPHEAAVRVITQGLAKLGILKGRTLRLIKEEAYRPYFRHGTSHWLGIDVHDVGDYRAGSQWRILKPGMVLTVEPGLYFPAGSQGVAKRWWNIGVRIEDDVAVTGNGCDILTHGAPKDPDDIEKLMNEALPG